MSDLIKREDAREAIEKLMDIHFDRQVVLAKARDAIGSLPSAEPKTGVWVSNHDGSWNCSECGLRVLVYAKGNYCPNCGAKMEGGEEE